ncbi:hypothetical protein [Rhodococcus koreensis]|uniref:hypothetical protein n=1 Tax=Rhodococcus koreensis TaxID=99653 RepID=UPI00367262EE
MINPILTPLHVTELDELQAHALGLVGPHMVDPDGFVADDNLAVDLRFIGLVAAM